jgi:hypothetical protein
MACTLIVPVQALPTAVNFGVLLVVLSSVPQSPEIHEYTTDSSEISSFPRSLIGDALILMT